MSYIEPGDVDSPDKWELVRVLYNGGQGQWAAAEGKWGGSPALAIRRNGKQGKPLGFPVSHDRATWFRVPEELRNGLRTLIDNGSFKCPEFVVDDAQGQFVRQHLLSFYRSQGGCGDKYQFVEWVADWLSRREAFMSVPALARLLNEAGYRTGYGMSFGGGRGTYRLVRGAYRRADRRGDGQSAKKVADAFRKPDRTYAYKR